MKFTGLVVVLCSLVAILAVPATTIAAPVTITVSGHIALVDDVGNLLGGAVTVGAPFTLTYTFDSTTPDTNTDDPTVGDYWHSASTYGLTVEVGGRVFKTDPSNIDRKFLLEVVNRTDRDNYLL